MRKRAARFKIAYVNESDPLDKRSWSGIHYFMVRALEKHCGDVTIVGPLHSRATEIGMKIDLRCRQLLKKRYDYTHSLLLSRSYSQIIKRKISGRQFDFIFAPEASTEIALLNVDVPIFYFSDVTFKLINDYYPIFSNLLRISAWEGNYVDRLAIKKSRLVFYPSEWAADSSCQDYETDKAKVRIVPFGANLESAPAKHRALSRKPSKDFLMLFVGVEWERKGGEIAFETLIELEKIGVRAKLIVCGCNPPSSIVHDRLIRIPFLNRNIETDRKRLEELFWKADLLLVPTRADCSPIVFCEASAYGLPVISTNTGGVSGIIKDGENGILLPPEARGEDYARVIWDILNDHDRYTCLVNSGRLAYEERLNWDTWATYVRDFISEVV